VQLFIESEPSEEALAVKATELAAAFVKLGASYRVDTMVNNLLNHLIDAKGNKITVKDNGKALEMFVSNTYNRYLTAGQQ